MEVIKSANQIRRWTLGQRNHGRTVGLVPTMGALHAGHLSLIRASSDHCDATLASIFVNPTQFGPEEDLDRYPRDLDRDFQLLRDAGTAAVFVPDNSEMYPAGYSTYIDPPDIALPYEGVHRPIHFRGVATIVTKLFHAAPATHAFFGRKDYQQWKVIEAITRDLNFGIEIIGCDTVREPDGLALSSRNQYLLGSDRQRALLLSVALRRVEAAVAGGRRAAAALQRVMEEALAAGTTAGVDRVDYAVVADADTLTPLARVDRTAVILIAAWVGQTRLLDNRVIDV